MWILYFFNIDIRYDLDLKGERKMLKKVRETIAEQLNVSASEITEGTRFKEDLGADSLDLFELVMTLEDEYSIEMPQEELENLKTVGAVVDFLVSQGIGE